MNVFKKLFIFIILSICASCSIYKSGGRNDFETAASQSNVHVSNAAADATCWEQPSKDALWETYEHMDIEQVDADTMRVCVKNENF